MKQRIQAYLARLAWIRENRAIPFIAGLTVVFLALSLAIHSPALLEVDRAITRSIQSVRSPLLDRVAIAFTFLGNTWTLIAFGACCLTVFAWYAKPRTGLICASTLLALPLNVWIKSVADRPRPSGDLVDVVIPAIGLSYPSGHAMASVALFGFLSLLSWVHIQRRPVRTALATAFALFTVGISLSRVYLGAHWISDVVGGSTAGLILIFLFAEIYKYAAAAELAPQPAILARAGP